MKKLIKELADEAGFLMWDGEEHAPVDAVVDWSCSYDYELEKFAELIISKCAGLFPNVYVEIETDYGHTPVIAADYIKKHFGVEE
jgi:hypothetical protein